jgi:acetyltransferase-like isoleucine patch superfamily enzyme
VRFPLILDSIRSRFRIWRNYNRGVRIGRNSHLDPRVVIDVRLGGQIVVGENCTIEAGVVLAPFGGSLKIGSNSYIGPYSVLYGHGGLEIGERVLIATQSVCIPANHGFDDISVDIASQPLTARGIRIENDCWLGAGVRVLDGVTIGSGSVISAGAVVTRSIPALSVAMGIPARVMRLRGERQIVNEIDAKR